MVRSLPARGAWIEIYPRRYRFTAFPSLPARGAWIEIVVLNSKSAKVLSLPARGAWIEICVGSQPSSPWRRRSPRGERGLKSLPCWTRAQKCRSLPARGAWIEMQCGAAYYSGDYRRSPRGERGLKLYYPRRSGEAYPSRSPRGERGLKFGNLGALRTLDESLPARGAWIEIAPSPDGAPERRVAPLTGSVD